MADSEEEFAQAIRKRRRRMAQGGEVERSDRLRGALDSMIRDRAREMDSGAPPAPRQEPSGLSGSLTKAVRQVQGLPLSVRFRKGGAMIIGGGKF